MATPNYFGSSYNIPALPEMPKQSTPYGQSGSIQGNAFGTPGQGLVPSYGTPQNKFYKNLTELPQELQGYMGNYLNGLGDPGAKQDSMLNYANSIQDMYGTDTEKFIPYALRGDTKFGQGVSANDVNLMSPVKTSSYFYDPNKMGIYSKEAAIDPITGLPADQNSLSGFDPRGNIQQVGAIPGLPQGWGDQYKGSYGAGAGYFNQGPGAINAHLSPDRLASDDAQKQLEIEKLSKYLEGLKGTYGDIEGIPDAASLYDMLVGNSVYGRGYSQGSSSILTPSSTYVSSQVPGKSGHKSGDRGGP